MGLIFAAAEFDNQLARNLKLEIDLFKKKGLIKT